MAEAMEIIEHVATDGAEITSGLVEAARKLCGIYERKYDDVPLDIPNDVILKLALMAHRRDITLNKLINELLRKAAENEIGAEEE